MCACLDKAVQEIVNDLNEILGTALLFISKVETKNDEIIYTYAFTHNATPYVVFITITTDDVDLTFRPIGQDRGDITISYKNLDKDLLFRYLTGT